MGTVVSGRVPPGAIIGNQRWRILGERDQDHYQKLENAQAYGGARGIPLTPSDTEHELD